MSSKERRASILKLLLSSDKPLKGVDLASEYNVTRQIIVKDIAILRAEGRNIIATPEGYIINGLVDRRIRKIIAVNHGRNELYDEMNTIIKYGGKIEDVIVEHPLYGEIKCNLMIKTIAELEAFVKAFEDSKIEPLSSLTGGLHLHTITAEDQDTLDKIEEEVIKKNYIVLD